MSNERTTVTGMVLSALPIGEYDRRVVLLTRERGKIAAFARGARRPKSQLIAATNPFVTGTFDVYEGRDSFTIHAANVDNYFTELSADIEQVWYGYYFTELADYFALANNDEAERLVLLYQGLRALVKKKLSNRLLRVVYEFKTLVLGGDYPNFFACAECQKSEGLRYYSPERRGAVCAACAGKAGGRPVGDSAVYALQYMTTTPAARVFSFDLKEAALEQVEAVTHDYYRRYVGHVFKSESFLEL